MFKYILFFSLSTPSILVLFLHAYIFFFFFFFFAGGGNLRKTPCGPCPRTVWDSYPLNLPTLSSALVLPMGPPSGITSRGEALAVLQLFLQCSSLDLYQPQFFYNLSCDPQIPSVLTHYRTSAFANSFIPMTS